MYILAPIDMKVKNISRKPNLLKADQKLSLGVKLVVLRGRSSVLIPNNSDSGFCGLLAVNVNKRIMKNYGQIQAPLFENQLGDLVYFTAQFNKM